MAGDAEAATALPRRGRGRWHGAGAGPARRGRFGAEARATRAASGAGEVALGGEPSDGLSRAGEEGAKARRGVVEEVEGGEVELWVAAIGAVAQRGGEEAGEQRSSAGGNGGLEEEERRG